MQPRLDFSTTAPEALRAVLQLEAYNRRSGIEEQLRHILALRASQLNGCAFCTDMHWKDARHSGVSEEKLSLLTCWREAPNFTDRERAALEWTETLTFVASTQVPDDVFERVRKQFSEVELANLTIIVGSINIWNRINVAFRSQPGHYQPAAAAKAHV